MARDHCGSEGQGLTVRLFLIGGISFPAEEAAGARWGQAALIMCWVFVFDLTIAVSLGGNCRGRCSQD